MLFDEWASIFFLIVIDSSVFKSAAAVKQIQAALAIYCFMVKPTYTRGVLLIEPGLRPLNFSFRPTK